jgi:uncharacterized protein YfaS (alpha-2-macroglobulin family)
MRVFIFLLGLSFLMATVAQETNAQELLRQAKTAYDQHSYQKAINFLNQVRQNFPQALGDEVLLLEAKCYSALNNHWQTIQNLESRIDAFSDPEKKLEGHLLLAQAYKTSRSNLSENLLRHFEIPFKHYNEKYKSKKTHKKELEDLLFLAQEALCTTYWDYGNYQDWQKLFQELKDPQKDWSRFMVQKRLEVDELRVQKILDILAYLKTLGGEKSHTAARASFLEGCFYVNQVADRYRQAQYYSPSAVSQRLRESFDLGIKAFYEVPLSDELADDAYYLAAYTYHHKKNDLATALQAYQKFLAEGAFRQSPWTSDTQQGIQKIQEEEIQLEVPRVFRSGESLKINMTARNVAQVTFNIRPVDLVKNRRFQSNYSSEVFDQANQVATLKQWTVATGIQKNYIGISKEIEVPSFGSGAYVLSVLGNKKFCQVVLLVSDMVLVTRQAKEKLLCYAIDGATGKPLPSTEVACSLWFYYQNQNPNSRYQVLQGKTDKDGLWVADLTGFGSFYQYSSEVVAKQDKHFAVMSDSYYPRGYQDRVQILGYTNQPVYRPGQKVEFKLIVRKQENGKVVNVANQLLSFYIQDPMGTKVYDRSLYTNEYGTFSDHFLLKEKPTLGQYQMIATLEGQQLYQENWTYPYFQVEEYKKPEFQVQVNATGESFSFNQEVEVSIHGEYYFGGPVAGGTVSYTIYTSPHYSSHHRPSKYEWYRSTRSERNPYAYYGRAYVAGMQEQSLDPEGNFKLKFTPTPQYGQEVDQVYFIEAQVVDKSRRMIQGQGTVYVTHRGFQAFLEPHKSLYLRGETLQVDLICKTANETPVACQGTYKLAFKKQNPSSPEKEEWQEVLQESVQTNEQGKAVLSCIVDSEGSFRLTFQTRDTQNREIQAFCDFWVVSEEFRGDQSRFSDIHLLSDKKIYEIGETAHLLVNSHLNDATALISVVADQSLITQQVVYIPGKSALFHLPILQSCTPNVFVHCLVVKDHQIYQNTLELTVPPTQYFSTVTLTTSKESYLPGATAQVELQTTDSKGNPLSMELSLGVVDASLYYIQPDPTPDIRKFFYGTPRTQRLGFRSSLEFRYSASGYLRRGSSPSYSTHPLPDPYQNWNYYFEGLRQAESYGLLGAGAGKASGEAWNAPAESALPQSEAVKSLEERSERESDDIGSSKEGLRRQVAPGVAKDMKKAKRESNEKAKGNKDDASGDRDKQESGQDPEFKEAKVRSDFRDNCFWLGQVTTDSSGKASIEVVLPDNLTTWTLTSRVIDLQNRVGQVKKNIQTQKQVLIRPQQPRFFRERDLVTLSAIVQNNLEQTLDVQVRLEIDDRLLQITTLPENEKIRNIKVRGKKDYRIDWVVSVKGEGKTSITMTALSAEDSDAVKQSFPVYLHGIEKFIGFNGVMVGERNQLAGDLSHTFAIDVPAERILESTEIRLNFSPTTASVIMEALPYLARYPYGCVEQTMSRFLPSVLTAKTLKNLNISIEEVLKKYQPPVLSNGITPELAPIACLNQEILADMIQKGLARLSDFQHSDGGWGWWKADTSNPYMTSYVLFGLHQARLAGVEVESARIQRAAQFLENQLEGMNLVEGEEIGNQLEGNRLAYMLYSLSSLPEMKQRTTKSTLGKGFWGILDFLYERRDLLNDYGRSLLALSFIQVGQQKEARDLAHQILDTVVQDPENQTAFWGNASAHYYWYQDGVETTAYALKALVAIEPSHPLLPQIAKWLVLKRQGIRWKSTKDTAMAIYGLLDYLKLTGEMNPNYRLRVRLGNALLKTIDINRSTLFQTENQIRFTASQIQTGSQTFSIEKEGLGNLYYSVSLTYFTLEEDIRAAQTELELTRRYYKVEKGEQGSETRTLLPSGVLLKSGDLIDVELELKTNQDCEYLVIENFKAAGCEPLELRSGSGGGSYLSHREMRDERVAFFIGYLPKGVHQYGYRTRAEIPGEFHAMPAMVHAMYAPHLRANSEEWRVKIVDE